MMKLTILAKFFTYILVIGVFFENNLAGQTLSKNERHKGYTYEIPEIASQYVLIYKPQPDIFSLKDTRNYRSGEIYYHWQPNDHTFIKGPDNRWHCFGITKPDDVKEDGVHEGEGFCFHAIAPLGSLKTAMKPEAWIDQPKFNVAGSGWAPFAIKIGENYSLISSSLGHAVSKDLYNWNDNGVLKAEGGNRDPNVLFHDGTYYLLRCNNRSVCMVTSKDFENWTQPVTIFTAPKESWNCESPSLIFKEGVFYLFWCLWDSDGSGAELPAMYQGHDPSTYDYRTYVYASDTPYFFQNKKPIAILKAHAPEVFQDEEGNWYISSADYPHRGINLAILEWKK